MLATVIVFSCILNNHSENPANSLTNMSVFHKFQQDYRPNYSF